MEIKKIQKLSNDWHSATWKVIEFENPGFEKNHLHSFSSYVILYT